MIFVYVLLIIVLSALLWRIRGGLWEEYIPMNKIWYAVAFSVYSCFYFSPTVSVAIIGFLDCYVSYQLYGWGKYIGALCGGSFDKYEPECELIDDLLDETKLVNYPRLYGFVGTTLTGLIITFLWGIFFIDLPIMLSGLGMGVCYWIGTKLEKLCPLGKGGWNWGEIIFGAYEGSILAWRLLC